MDENPKQLQMSIVPTPPIMQTILKQTFEGDVAQVYSFDHIDITQMKTILHDYNKTTTNSFFFTIGTSAVYTKGNMVQERNLHIDRVNVTARLFDIDVSLDEMVFELGQRSQNVFLEESGMYFAGYSMIQLFIGKYKTCLGTCHQELPFRTTCIINVKNNNNYSFKYAIAASKHPTKSNNPLTYERYFNEFNWDGIEFPITMEGVTLFEQNNFKVNIFEILPRNEQKERTASIIHLGHEDAEGVNIMVWRDHFVSCMSLHKYFKKGQHHVCLRCTCYFSSLKVLNIHKESCVQHLPAQARFPPKEEEEFRQFQMMIKVPFAIYISIKSWNYSIREEKESELRTKLQSEQKPVAIGLKVVTAYPNMLNNHEEYKYFYGPDGIKVFIEHLKQLSDMLKLKLKTNIEIDQATIPATNNGSCSFCHKPLSGVIVNDHDHYTGKFRGHAHKSCNLIAHVPKFVPCYFHDEKKHDFQLFLLILYSKYPEMIKDVRANGDSNYLSFTFGCLRFLDSSSLIPYKLETLGEKLCATERIYSGQICNSSSIYPNDFVKGKCWDDIYMIMNGVLPAEGAFYNKIIHEDYVIMQNEYIRLECTDFRAYTSHCLQRDVLLLADVVETFRTNSIDHSGIDPAHTYSVQELSWLSGLKMSTVVLKYIKYIDQQPFIEKMVRGGYSGVCGTRYVQANHPNIAGYDQLKDKSEIRYLRMNSLYSKCMTMELPTEIIGWGSNEYQITEEGYDQPGYIYEVDLNYPNELKEATKSFPLFLVKDNLNLDELSEWQNQRKPSGYDKAVRSGKNKKILQVQRDVKNYVLDGRLLDLYVRLGVKIDKIHRRLNYKKSKWLQGYITSNIDKQDCANAFGALFYELLNRSFYGKMMEDSRKRQDVKIVTSENQFKTLAAKPQYKCSTIFSNGLIAVHQERTSVLYEEFTYVDAVIVDLANYTMYDFVYNDLYKVLAPNYEILMSDTDSIVVHLKNGATLDNVVLDDKKDNVPDHDITEFICLKARTYAMKLAARFNIRPLTEKQSQESEQKDLNFDNFLDNFDDKRIILQDGVSTEPAGYVPAGDPLWLQQYMEPNV